MKKLENKTAVITGAASGMGKAMALLFAREGAKVVASDWHADDLSKVVDEIRKEGGVAEGIVCNVASKADVEKLISRTMETFGSLDILINNAGVMDEFAPVDKVSDEMWDRVISVNLNGPFYACRLAVPIMLKQGSGNIINISSIGGLQGSRAGASYTASKHGLIGLSKNIGFMYAQKGIRCNVIAPGGVNTNIVAGMKQDPFGYERCVSGGANNPRMAESEEIARTALFLASDDSSFINGAVITADGGWIAY